jgi:hypothetical protein
VTEEIDVATTFSIFDVGNLVASFDNGAEAVRALERVATADAEPREGLLLVAFDEAGNVVADFAPGERTVTD